MGFFRRAAKPEGVTSRPVLEHRGVSPTLFEMMQVAPLGPVPNIVIDCNELAMPVLDGEAIRELSLEAIKRLGETGLQTTKND